MATIIGVRSSSFKGEHGEMITGKTVYLTTPLKEGSGVSSERVFLTIEKLQKYGYDPEVGDEVRIEYNRYGRCEALHPIEQAY